MSRRDRLQACPRCGVVSEVPHGRPRLACRDCTQTDPAWKTAIRTGVPIIPRRVP